jgi:hypothetical protein
MVLSEVLVVYLIAIAEINASEEVVCIIPSDGKRR